MNHKAAKSGERTPSPLQNDIKEMTQALRVLEGRHNNIRKKSQVIEQNMLSNYSKYGEKLVKLTSDIGELKKAMNKVEENLNLILNNIDGYAKQQDVKVIERYLQYWNPLDYARREDIPTLAKDLNK
jgi:chromosome segregation ATPase